MIFRPVSPLDVYKRQVIYHNDLTAKVLQRDRHTGTKTAKSEYCILFRHILLLAVA